MTPARKVHKVNKASRESKANKVHKESRVRKAQRATQELPARTERAHTNWRKKQATPELKRSLLQL